MNTAKIKEVNGKASLTLIEYQRHTDYPTDRATSRIMGTPSDEVLERLESEIEELYVPGYPDYSAKKTVVERAKGLLNEIFVQYNPKWPEPFFNIAHDKGVEIVWRGKSREIMLHATARRGDTTPNYFVKEADGSYIPQPSPNINKLRSDISNLVS